MRHHRFSRFSVENSALLKVSTMLRTQHFSMTNISVENSMLLKEKINASQGSTLC
jgi:hypothetical protein